MISLLSELYDRLTLAGYHVVDVMPDSHASPYILIGAHDDDAAAHKNGRATYQTTLQIDYFCDDSRGRFAVENDVCKIKNAIRQRNISSRIMIDNSTQRTLYHVVFELQTYI